jgi:hypothetical protein
MAPMTNLNLISLPRSARAFVADLLQGCGGLCAKKLPELLHCGEMYAVLPEGVSPAEVEAYESDAIASGDETTHWLAERINAFGREQPAVLIIQDIWFGPEDFKSNPWSAETWANGDELYLWCETGRGSSNDIDRCLRSPRSYYWVGFLVADLNAASWIKTGSPSIDELASRVVESYVSAYDHGSYLIWTPGSKPRP